MMTVKMKRAVTMAEYITHLRSPHFPPTHAVNSARVHVVFGRVSGVPWRDVSARFVRGR